jgi:uncharacterized protein YwqG
MSGSQVALIFAGGGLGLLLLTILSSWIHHIIDLRRARNRRSTGKSFVRSRMRRLARPTLLLTPAKVSGFSKLGGLPDLPSDQPWPVGEREPRAFVAQIDLGAIQPHVNLDWLPTDGRLYAFFDDERNGAADCVQIIHSLAPPAPAAEPPAPISKRWCFSERRIAFMKFDSVPSFDWLEIEPGTVDFDDCELETLRNDLDLFGDEIEHRIGGYPGEIQSTQMALDCEYMRRGNHRDWSNDVPDTIRRAAREWRLLLQIDSDPALNMNWWDAGRLYVFIRARDAKRGNFSKTVTITQTH